MKTKRMALVSRVLAVFLLFTLAPAGVAEERPAKTALDEYVHRFDPTFSWKVVRTIPGDGFQTFVVDLKSQTWRLPGEVDRLLWQHWLLVTRPHEVRSGTAFLRIGGGRNGTPAPNRTPELLAKMALATNTVAAEVTAVPNQPLIFHGDGKPRSEDDLVAYTQARYMDTGDANWPARMPMVKSAVKAMDAIQALLASDEGGQVEVTGFVVSGGSKRGWTTWLTGAVDPRVKAIIPVVIDTLNLRDSRLHRFASYGFWAPSLRDYVHHGVFQRMNTPQMRDLMELVDPYAYRHRLGLPKYIVNASGDEFFPPDASQFYYDDLEGEKHLRYVPNARHSLSGTDARDTILAFYRSIVTGTERPRYSWTLRDNGSFEVKTPDPPQRVTLWQATNPEARDFRLETLGPAYSATPLEANDEGVYVGRVDSPAQGFTAFFVELTYDTGSPQPLKFTTSVHILPDVLPFAHKDPTQAKLPTER